MNALATPRTHASAHGPDARPSASPSAADSVPATGTGCGTKHEPTLDDVFATLTGAAQP